MSTPTLTFTKNQPNTPIWFYSINATPDFKTIIGSSGTTSGAGNAYKVFSTSDLGKTWVAKLTQQNNYYGCKVSNNGTKYAILSDTSIFLSIDSGKTFTQTKISERFLNLTGSSDNTILYATPEGFAPTYDKKFIYKSINSGITWDKIPILNDYNTSIGSIVSSADGLTLAYILDQFPGIYISKNGGNTWTFKNIHPKCVSIKISSSGQHIYVIPQGSLTSTGRLDIRLINNTLLYSNNYGDTWISLPLSSGQSKYQAAQVACSSDGSKVATLVFERGTTINYMMMYSESFGNSWSVIPNINGINLMVSDDGKQVLYTTSEKLGGDWTDIINVGNLSYTTAAPSAAIAAPSAAIAAPSAAIAAPSAAIAAPSAAIAGPSTASVTASGPGYIIPADIHPIITSIDTQISDIVSAIATSASGAMGGGRRHLGRKTLGKQKQTKTSRKYAGRR